MDNQVLQNVKTQEIENGVILNKNINVESFVLIGEINNFDLIDKLIIYLKKVIGNSLISGKTNVKAEHSDWQSFVQEPDFHYFLKIIHPFIHSIYKKNFIVREVWGNIYSKKNHHAIKHSHKGSAFCGILYCTDGPGPGTYFHDYDITVNEKKGRFVLFSPLLYHSVSEFNYTKERITIAFNFDEWSNVESQSNNYKISVINKEIKL